MALSAIQFQRGLSLSEFQRLHGSKGKCEAALENTGWHRLLDPPLQHSAQALPLCGFLAPAPAL